MNADQVRAYVAAMWPEALQSPVAKACLAFEVEDETNRAIEFAKMPRAGDAKDVITIAREYATSCIEACEAMGLEYDEETLSHNVESNFPELSLDQCDEVAARAIENYGGAT